MEQKQITLEDTLRQVRVIEYGDQVRAFNQMLMTVWMSPGRRFDDSIFVEKLWKPLNEQYGDLGIITVEQLEMRTGHGVDDRVPSWDRRDNALVNGHSYRYHRLVCKLLQVCVGPIVACLSWAGLVFEFKPGAAQMWMLTQSGRLL